MHKPYTTFAFFKIAIAITGIALVVLFALEYIWHFSVLVPGLALLGLAFVILTFRVSQLMYRFHLDRAQDVNQVESWMWLYQQFTPSIALPPTRGIAGSPDFLKVVVEYCQLKQPKVIVEASSGVSTMIISELLMHKGSDAEHLALEHEKFYADQSRDRVKNPGSKVLHAPLKSYTINGQSWQWYDISALDHLSQIDLLVIDGPPEPIQHLARYPAIPLLWDKLSPNALIIADDADRASERQTIKKWEEEFGLKVKFIRTEKGVCILERG
ncbi:MAG: hypothetical protein DHS20C18_47420 [Saprospiraceae bacterium]|nr:MAG: hypothetical protein DHS20C18_47420 [Saprospiraceae bacterium]